MRGKHPMAKSKCQVTIPFILPTVTAIDNGSAYLDLSLTIEPLLSQHGEKHDEEGSGQAGVEDGLDVDDSEIRASVLRDSGVFTQ